MEKGYDAQSVQPYKGGMNRRNFLKLAAATLGLAVTGGCLPVYDLSQRSGPFFTKPGKQPTWEDFPQNYLNIELEPIDKSNLKLTDFVLKKDELEGRGIRLAREREKTIMKLGELNPSKKNLGKYPFKENLLDEFKIEDWIAGEYIEKSNYPLHHLVIETNKCKTKEICEKLNMECKRTMSKTSKNIGLRVYHHSPFNIFIMNFNFKKGSEGPFIDKNHEQEHLERAEAYAEKRGLEFVAGTF